LEQPKHTEFSADEFVAWAMNQPQGRFELDNGVIVAMAPERVDHTRAKRNLIVALHQAVGDRLPCEALPDGASVRVNDRTVHEPDAIVRCGPPAPGDAIETNDPVVVVEVVSPSSRGIDRGAKLAGDFALPSVRHYLIVDTDQRVVIHHQLRDADRIDAQILREGRLTLDPPGLAIELADIFAGI